MFCSTLDNEPISKLGNIKSEIHNEFVIIQDGQITKRKKLQYISEKYINFLLDKFILKGNVESVVKQSKR